MGTAEKIPILSKESPNGSPAEFKNSIGILLTTIGCAVGTGNIWRFSREVALHSGPNGALCFLIPWLLFLGLWSIPMIIVEYATGRYTRRSTVMSMQQLAGNKSLWAGAWIVFVNFMLGTYYHVIMGWCLYYMFHTMINPLPTSDEESLKVFNGFTENQPLVVLVQAVSVAAAGVFLLRGVKTIEKASMVMVPVLLTIVLIIFIWSMTRPGAGTGLCFFFSPTWEQLKNPEVWVAAASQNAFDTAAGSGQFIAYASYMSDRTPVIKYALLIPIFNNIVSLISGMTTFATAFSNLEATLPNATQVQILELLQTAGPGSTGLTFVWFPVLLSSAGTMGRILAVVFFLCLFIAALTSLMAILEGTVRVADDFKISRYVGVPVTVLLTFILGIGSSLNLHYLTNQDFTWGFALIVNGLCLQLMVIIYGTGTFRETVINSYRDQSNDWSVPKAWEWTIKVVAPVEAGCLLVWWFVYGIIYGYSEDDNQLAEPWYAFSPVSLLPVLLQWLTVMAALILANALLLKFKPDWLRRYTGSSDLNASTDAAPVDYTPKENSAPIEMNSPLE